MRPDHNVLPTALDWVAAGRRVALATVIETWGSAPTPVGSQLVIDCRREFRGLGVGRVRRGRRHHGSDRCHRIAASRETLEFGVADETAWRVGLACGGKIRVHVERVD